MLDNLLSKVIAAGLAAGVFLLWWPAHLPSTGVQWLVLRGLAWTLAFEVLALSFVPLEQMATRAGDPPRSAGRAQRVRSRLAAAPRPARASGAVMLAFTGLLLPGLLLLHTGHLPVPARRAHHAGGAQGGRAQGRARADRRRARGRPLGRAGTGTPRPPRRRRPQGRRPGRRRRRPSTRSRPRVAPRRRQEGHADADGDDDGPRRSGPLPNPASRPRPAADAAAPADVPRRLAPASVVRAACAALRSA